jgi:hypothetical protein
MIICNKIGRCDSCMKENTRVLVTRSPSLIQGQICLKCFKRLNPIKMELPDYYD